MALQEKQKELESKFEALKRETKEADAQVDTLDEDIDAETKEKNRLQAEEGLAPVAYVQSGCDSPSLRHG